MAVLEGTPGEVQRFAVDWMLGRLARWLRILGHDVAYGATCATARWSTARAMRAVSS